MNNDGEGGISSSIGFDDESEEEATGGDVDFTDFLDIAKHMQRFEAKQSDLLGFQDVEQIVSFLHTAWCSGGLDMHSLQKRNVAYFGDRGVVLQNFRFYSGIAVALSRRLEAFPDEPVADKKTVSDRLNQISANVLYGYDGMIQCYRQLYCNTPELSAVLPPLRMDAFFSPIVEDEMRDHQKLIRYLLEECSRRGYRRQGTAMYAPKFTEDGNFTRTYTIACQIVEFVYDAIYPYEQHQWLYAALTSSRGTASHCVDYLTNCREDSLPVLVKNRTRFSFQNGLFDAERNRFYTYDSVPDDWGDEVCSNFMDVYFDEETYAQHFDPLDIPCPNVQKILDSQDFPPEVCRWFFASIGRLLFDVGTMDNWQYFIFCKGTAGSGKSTLLRLASKFYDNVDVGTLMSEGQKGFSVEHLFDRFLFFCYDADDKMNFSATRWNQMVAGEPMSIERKNLIALSLTWKTTGGFAGNSYPPWIDVAGNVSRRMLLFMFNNVVKNVDTRLFEKCHLELGAFMRKAVGCYHYLLEKHGERGIWDKDVLPKYFHQTKAQMQAETNPLQAFMQSEQCVIDEAKHVGFNTFRAAYMAFCESLRLTKKRLTEDFANPLFSPAGIQIITPNGEPEDFDGYSCKYLSGIGLA